MIIRPISKVLILVLALALAAPGLIAPSPAAAKGIRFIRDAEIENTIRLYATPLFQAAGLNPQAIDVYLINDPRLNAFVTGGQKMFIHTGLLQEAETPLQVMGVIAHEAGHIAGGHIVARRDEMRNATAKLIASYVLGLGAALASGRPDVGGAVIRGGQDAAIASLLAYSRGQESAADQAAIRFLSNTGHSPKGLLEFFEKIGAQEVLISTSQDPYFRTHPVTSERIASVRQAVSVSPVANEPAPEILTQAHDRMRAKLMGFLFKDKALKLYKEEDQSVAARYGRAIALHQKARTEESLAAINSLIAEAPDDPYFRELKGQILFESQRLEEALPEYQKAVDLLPDSPLLRQTLAHLQLELNDPQYLDRAIAHLRFVTGREQENVWAWQLLSRAEGMAGNKAASLLARAEEALIRNKPRDAKGLAQRALELLPKDNMQARQRARDISNHAETLIKRG